jgi:hypothetical protein
MNFILSIAAFICLYFGWVAAAGIFVFLNVLYGLIWLIACMVDN